MKSVKHFFQNHWGAFLLLLVLSLPAIVPLLQKGFFLTDDAEWMIIRFSAFYAALGDGQFPVRFVERLNFGYGYPVTTFLYPGFLYFAVPLQLLKIGFVTSIKIMIGVSLLGSTIFTYLWLSKFFSKIASLIGALFSLYLPYHLFDVYTRGSVGEIFALLWIPFILWMIERKSIFFVSIGIFLLLIAHNSLALLFLPVLFLYAWFRQSLSTKEIIISFFLGFGLASFFIIPAVFELSLTQFSQTKISDPLAYFADLQLIGISSFFIWFSALFLFVTKKKSVKNKKIIALFLFVSFISIVISSSVSSVLWQLTGASFVQFPFRILSYLIPALGFLCAFVVASTRGKKQWIGIISIALIGVFSALPYTAPKEFFDKGDAYYTTNDSTTTVHDEYIPLWVKEKPVQRPENKVVVAKGEAIIDNVLSTNKTISFSTNAKESVTVQINTIYWPGWTALVDGKETQISYNNPQGVIQLFVPSGNHTVKIIFGETLMRMASNMLSLLALVILSSIQFFRFKLR